MHNALKFTASAKSEGVESSVSELRATVEMQVYRLALLLTANPDDAEGVSRRALTRAWQVLLESGAENASEPLQREVVCGAVDALRLRRGDLRGWLEDPLTDVRPAITISSGADLRRIFATPAEGQRLARALDELVPLDRVIVILREAEQMSLDDAARLAGMSRREAELRLERGRAELRQQLAKRPATRAAKFTMVFPGSVQNT